ncbi:hypothetical protein [Microbacterium sp. NPDC058389]|uniref:hypothetical protein n=1 Tax=Microbacterium sp. NPDC058389 TaxID=3346475 RepID=UPI00364F5F9E
MTLPVAPHTATEAGSLPGRAVIARIRRVLVVALVAGFAYTAVTVASAGGCAGGSDGSGGFVDSAGRSTDLPPTCVQLTLRPTPLVVIAIGLIVLFAIGRVLKAVDERAALRTLDRAVAGIGVLAAVAIIVSHVWFQLVPLDDLMSGSWTVFSPFPFGTIDVSTEPMPGMAG